MINYVEFRARTGKDESSGGASLDLSAADLSSDDLKVLMPDILAIANLTELILFANPGIEEFPDFICQLRDLRKLDIGGTNITGLPESIDQLSNLTHLAAYESKIRELPGSIGRLSKLKVLALEGNMLTHLPNTLSGLSSLITLDIPYNRITELPETLENLPRIQKLFFQHNPLSTDAISLLSRIGQRPGVIVQTNLAAHDRIQSYEDVLKIFYPDDQERVLMIGKLEACDLDPVTITYGGDDQEVTSAKDVLKKFWGKVPVDSESERNFYGTTTKMLFEKILDPNTSREEANTIVVEMGISLGDCSTPLKTYLEQKMIGELIKGGNKLSHQNELMIERLALVEKTGALSGLKSSDRIEEVNGLVNLVFSRNWVDQAHIAMDRVAPNVVFVGGIGRDLPPVSSYPVICFSLIKDNPELMEQFATLICETKDNKLVQTIAGEYKVDEEKMKKLKENYLGTGDELVRMKCLSMYLQDMNTFIEKEGMKEFLYIEHFKEANERDLANLPKQEKELKRLLGEKTGKENIEQEYKRYMSEMKMSLIDFRKDMAQKKPMSQFTTPIISRRSRPDSPDRDQNHTEGQGELKVQHVSQRRL
ncbi:leucine-rich repeat domain-containing protein [Flavobacterium sp. LAR06]|uniref:leucine-rich repeat domain-containing protein n=1 Tax=Flavobacterium sp. LAR06 TaxID=3064897 RepID=UPI0035C25DAB